MSAFDNYRAFVSNFLPVDPLPESGRSFDDFKAFFASCVQSFSVPEAVKLANEAARGFSVPEEFSHDVDAVLKLGSLVEFIRQMHAKNDPYEFNAARAQELLGLLSDEDISARHRTVVEQIAEFGSPYCVPPGFTPLCELQELRVKTLQLGLCQLKAAVKLRGKGKCLLLKVSDMPPGFFETFGIDTRCMAHWTLKWGPDGELLPDGRFLLDLNEDPTGAGMSLNSDAAKALSREYYGELSYPSILDFIGDVRTYCERNGYALSDMRFFVEDNKGAFNSHKKRPEDCRLICVRVSHNWCMLPIYGCFGHHAEPFAWEQPAAALDALLRKRLHGVFRRYVDDRFNAAHFDHVAADHAVVRELNDMVYAPGSLDPEKSQPDGTTMTAIGWFLDAIAGTIRPSDKGIKKLVLAFFAVSTRSDASWSVTQIQMLASLAQRYCVAITGMSPFRDMFSVLLRKTDSVRVDRLPYMRIEPSSAAKFAVHMWRAAAIALWADPARLSVPMFSLLKDRHPTVAFRSLTDAAHCLGVQVFDHSGVLLHWSSFELPFINESDLRARGSSFQNCREFMGVILTILIMRVVIRAPPGSAIAWTNDNVSALRWAETNKASSAYAQAAFAAYSWMLVRFGYHVASTEHIAGASDQMTVTDGLSRQFASALTSLDRSKHIDMCSYAGVEELFLLISPLRILDQPDSIATTFARVAACVRAL